MSDERPKDFLQRLWEEAHSPSDWMRGKPIPGWGGVSLTHYPYVIQHWTGKENDVRLIEVAGDRWPGYSVHLCMIDNPERPSGARFGEMWLSEDALRACLSAIEKKKAETEEEKAEARAKAKRKFDTDLEEAMRTTEKKANRTSSLTVDGTKLSQDPVSG